MMLLKENIYLIFLTFSHFLLPLPSINAEIPSKSPSGGSKVVNKLNNKHASQQTSSRKTVLAAGGISATGRKGKQDFFVNNPELMAADSESTKDGEFQHTTKQHLFTMDLSPTSIAELDATIEAETDEEVAQVLLHSYRQRAFRDGDVIIGVLLPIHRPASAKSYPVRCSIIWEEYGMHRMEQLIWTIEEINKRQEILPGVTLGYDIRDTCWTTQVALERTMDFIKSKAGDDHCSPGGGAHRSPLAALLGAASSEISVAVQEVAQMFDIPQIDFGSTSPQLSDKSMFRLFARVIPSDQEQATMLVDVIRHFGWQYVHGIYTEGNYGEKGYEAFRDILTKSALCLASSRKFLLRVPDNHEQYAQLISDLAKHQDTRVIVCFCDGLGVRALFRTLTKHNLNGSYVVVGSDGWNVRKDIIRGFESAANGGLSVTHWSPRVPDFEERFYALTPHTVPHDRNPWFAEYWAQKHGCLMSASTLLGLTASPFSRKPTTRSLKYTTAPFFTRSEKADDRFYNFLDSTTLTNRMSNASVTTPPTLVPKIRFCTGNETTPANERTKQEAKLGFVVNSVYAVAHAIRNILLRECWGKSIRTCEHLYPFVNGSMLFESLRSVSFINYANEHVRFDTNMDGAGKYQLWNFQSVPGTSRPTLYRYMPIGEWENNELLINDSIVAWPNNISSLGKNEVPASFCSKPCNFDQIKVVPNVALPCCWDCIPCPAGDYVSNGTKCVTCKRGFAPNELLTACEKVKIRFRSLSEIESVVIVTISSVGMTGVLIVWFAYYFTRRLSVPRAFSLIGILVTFTTVFTLLARPTLLTCYFSRILPPLAQSILFSPIFNRANAMVRIVNSSRKLIIDRRPRFISTNSQIALTCFIIGAQCTVVVMMLIWEAAEVKIVYPSFNVALEVCRSSFYVTSIPLAFNGVIMFAAMVYALRTRKIKEMIRTDESIYYPMVMGANAMLTFSIILLFYALGTEDHVLTAVHQLLAGFSTMVMFILPLFSGPEQVEFDENTFAESVRHDLTRKHSMLVQGGNAPNNENNDSEGEKQTSKMIDRITTKRVQRRKSVSMRLWDTMTVMREVAASTKTRQYGATSTGSGGGDDSSFAGRSPRITVSSGRAPIGEHDQSASNSEDVFQSTETGELKRDSSRKSLKRRFFTFSSQHGDVSRTTSSSSTRDKEKEMQEKYYRSRNAHVLVTGPSDESEDATGGHERSRSTTPEPQIPGSKRGSGQQPLLGISKDKRSSLDDQKESTDKNNSKQLPPETIEDCEGDEEQEEEEEELEISVEDEDDEMPQRPLTKEEKQRQEGVCWKSLSRKTDQLLAIPPPPDSSTGTGTSKMSSSTSRDSIKAALEKASKTGAKKQATGILNAVNLRGKFDEGDDGEKRREEICRTFKSPALPVKGSSSDLEANGKNIRPPPLPPPPLPHVARRHVSAYNENSEGSSSVIDRPIYARLRPPVHVVESRFSEGSSANIHLGGLITDFSPHRSFDENFSAGGESSSAAGFFGESSSADSINNTTGGIFPTASWRGAVRRRPVSQMSNINTGEEMTSFSLVNRGNQLLYSRSGQQLPHNQRHLQQQQQQQQRHIYGQVATRPRTSRSAGGSNSGNKRTLQAENALAKDKKTTNI